MLNKLEYAIDFIIKALTTILLGALTVLVCYTVFLRFVVGAGFPAGEELCRYLFVWASFFGIILGVKANSHMSIGFLEEKFPNMRNVLKIIHYIFYFLFFGIVACYGTVFACQAASAQSTLLPITMNYVYAAVPVCGYTCLVLTGIRLIRDIQTIGKHTDKEDQP